MERLGLELDGEGGEVDVHGEQHYNESWKVINEMSGCKRPREGQLAAAQG